MKKLILIIFILNSIANAEQITKNLLKVGKK